MSEYTLRDKDGIAKAVLLSSTARDVMDRMPGHFRKAVYKNFTATVWECDADMKFGTSAMQIYLWKGDVLVPRNK